MTHKVLLTGGFGTLGGRLSTLLAQDPKIDLRLASRFSKHSPTWAPDATTITVDFDSTQSIKNMLNGITHVVHLVAMTDFESRAEPMRAQTVNTEYTRRVVEQCSKHVRLVYLSTIHVYGANLSGVVTESSNTNPADAYAQTHLDAEMIVKSAHNAGELEGISLRNANGFGAPMSSDAKIWQIIANDLCRQAVEKRQLTLNSHGLQFRNFIPFTDVCDAVRHCLFMPSNLIDNTTFNLGSDATIRVLDMAELIAARCAATLGYTPAIDVRGAPPDVSPTSFTYDSNKLRSTGLSLNTRIETEIDRLLNACQNWFG